MNTNTIIIIGLSFIFILMFFSFCFFFILKKENKNGWLAFVPIVNAYLYLKMCKLPTWIMFIPVINFIVFFFSTFCFAKYYSLNRIYCYLSILFPFFTFPYIAFSKCKSKDKKIGMSFIESAEEIDLLESSLVSTNKTYFEDEDNTIYESIAEKKVVNDAEDEQLIIDEDPFSDEYVYETDIIDDTSTTNTADEFLEIEDTIFDDLSLDNLDSLEETIVSNSNVEKNLVIETEDYKSELPSNEAIAFGGNKQIENFDAVQTKNDTLKCSRCGSSLIGAESVCPGCGAQIKNT